MLHEVIADGRQLGYVFELSAWMCVSWIDRVECCRTIMLLMNHKGLQLEYAKELNEDLLVAILMYESLRLWYKRRSIDLGLRLCRWILDILRGF